MILTLRRRLHLTKVNIYYLWPFKILHKCVVCCFVEKSEFLKLFSLVSMLNLSTILCVVSKNNSNWLFLITSVVISIAVYGQHVCDFRACARCNRPAYGCKCSRLDSAGLVSNPQTSQFSGPLAMDSDQTIQDPGEAQAGPSGINTRRMSQSSSHLNENSEEPVSVSFRASTNIQAYKEQKFLDFFTKRRSFRLDVATERPMNGLLNPYLSRGSPYFVDRLAASEANDVAQCKDDPPVTNPSTNRASRNENTSESQENRPMDEESSAKAELEQLHAKLIGLLECPVCLEPIVPPIHQCRRGHLVRLNSLYHQLTYVYLKTLWFNRFARDASLS